MIFLLAIMLMAAGCGTSRKSKTREPEFVPLHPPVVVPHQWDEAADTTNVQSIK